MTLFHAGGSASWALAPEIISRLSDYVTAGSDTLETGAGASTVFFAERGCQHTAITPALDEIERIKAFCAEARIGLSGVKFINAPSQDAMPLLSGGYDLILIDGGHGFPIPQIDWFYGAQRLRLGGVMAIDDIHTWTGAILKGFLDQDLAWQSLGSVDYKTAFYRLVKPFKYEEWNEQPFVLTRSKPLILGRKLRRFPGRIARGEWGSLFRSFRRSVR